MLHKSNAGSAVTAICSPMGTRFRGVLAACSGSPKAAVPLSRNLRSRRQCGQSCLEINDMDAIQGRYRYLPWYLTRNGVGRSQKKAPPTDYAHNAKIGRGREFPHPIESVGRRRKSGREDSHLRPPTPKAGRRLHRRSWLILAQKRLSPSMRSKFPGARAQTEMPGGKFLSSNYLRPMGRLPVKTLAFPISR